MRIKQKRSFVFFWSWILCITTLLNGCGSDIKNNPKSPTTSAVTSKPDNRKKIIFFGDSITALAVNTGGFIDLLNTYLVENNLDSTYVLIGKGVSSNKVTGLQDRVDRDVIALEPSTVFIYVGINDVWHSLQGTGTPLDQYEFVLTDLIKKIKKETGAKVVLCTPSVIGEKKNGMNQLDSMLNEYADRSRSVATKTAVPLCDLRTIFVNSLQFENTNDVASGLFTYDGVHLSGKGNKLVANAMVPFIEK